MTRLIVFVTLLAVQYVRGVTESDVIVPRGDSLHLKTGIIPNVSKCKLQTNDGELYEYDPGVHVVPDVPGNRITSMDRTSCYVRVASATEKDAGLWKITAHATATGDIEEKTQKEEPKAQEFKYRVYIEETKTVAPSKKITVQEGLFVYAEIQNLWGDVKTCTVTSPQKKKVDLMSLVDNDIRLYGKCGFQLLAKESDNGLWTFEATTTWNSGVIYSADLTLNVYKDDTEKLPVREGTLKLERGKSGQISVGPSSVKFCELRNPQGTRLPLIQGSCTYNIPTVTILDDGTWTAYYGVQGRLHTKVLYFRVVTYASRSITSDVTYLKNGDVQLRCNVHHANPKSFSFCRYTRPDGEVLNVSPGIGSQKYSTFGVPDGAAKERNVLCGLTIHKPDNIDYGSWRCEISSEYDTSYSGSVLRVNKSAIFSSKYPPKKPETVSIVARKIYVKKDDRFTIKCLADISLDYCWVRSPNGTTYSVTPKAEDMPPFTLPYEGAGLDFGECGAQIDKASRTDDGEWSCHMGVSSGTEVMETLPVVVADSYLIPNVAEVLATEESITSLSCRILPGTMDRVVDYCRWIRPDGRGIYNGASHRYTTSTIGSECRLFILKYDPREDAGSWTCVAGLNGYSLEESRADVSVRTISFTSSSYGVLLGLAVSGCVILMMGVCALSIVYVQKRRRALQRRRQQQQQPIHHESRIPPKSLNPNYVTEEFKY